MSLIKNRKNIIVSASCIVIGAISITTVQAQLPEPYKQVCGGLGSNNSPTPEQQNFKNICNDIIVKADSDDNEAIAALRHEELSVQGNASLDSSRKHTNHVTARINGLRQSITGGASGDNNGLLESSRWGFFANVGYNKGDRKQTIGVDGAGALGDASQATVQGERAADFDGNELSIGLDYRLPGEKMIVGAAFGYNKLNSHFTDQNLSGGNTKLKGQHLSIYTSYLPSDKIYMDGIVSIGNNSINGSRPIPVYDSNTGTVLATDGKAFADTDSQQLSASIGMGYEFNRNALNITPYIRLDYTNTDIDAYTETVLDNNPSARNSSGMALAVEKQSVDSLVGVLGIRTSYPISSSGGVFVPQASLELNRQFRQDERFIDATLPVAEGLNTPKPSAQTSQLDRTYLKLGLGVSALFPNGHSGFIQIESLQASNDLSDTAIKAGYKLEF